MQFICVVTASYTLGFLMTKSPGLVFRMKHKILKKEMFFGVFMYGKNAYHTISWYEKNAYHAIFIVFFGLWNSMN